ncbi:hypothetical protein LPJ81_002128 [Coemansia sp. IMI 209127]|nr:hypothetical protein LPJ81_002128 [Coemansia sp. IMI 209127]
MRINLSDVELQRAKDVLDSCDLVSNSTKGCYSSRIALWMHYCTVCCNGDEQVTGQRLADYVEWMVSSGSAERIRQGTTHIQQVLRNQLQGVLCYWRIQNASLPNAEDPRSDPTFKVKWQQIVMRYPSSRHSRRAEPIYGIPRPPVMAEPIANERSPAGGNVNIAPYPGHMGAQPGPGGYSALRQAPPTGASSPAMSASAIQGSGRNPNYRPHPSQMNQPRQSSPSLGPHPYAQQPPGASHRSWHQPPYDDRAQPSHHMSPPNGHAPAPYLSSGSNRPPMNGPGGIKYPQGPASYNQQSQTVPERVPPGSGAYHPSKPSYPTAPQHPGSLLHQRPSAPHLETRDPRMSPRSQSSQQHHMRENMTAHPLMGKGGSSSVPPTSGQHDPNMSRMSVDSEEIVTPAMSSRVPDNADISLPASDGATAVPSSPKTSGSQYVLEGIVPEDIPEWSSDDAKESADAPEGHLLNMNESIALSIRQLGIRPVLQMQARAHILLGLSSWIPASSRTELTLGDIWTEEPSEIPLPDVEPQVNIYDSVAEAENTPEMQANPEEPGSGTDAAAAAAADQSTPDAQDKEMTDGSAREKTPEQQQPSPQEDRDMAEPENTDAEQANQTVDRSTSSASSFVADRSTTKDEAEEVDMSAKALLDIKNQEPGKQQELLQPQAQPLRVLSVALRTFGGRASSNSPVGDKALVLRHNNPLLCPWGALAFMLFSRWHVANEPAPDFGTTAWQSMKLFPGLFSNNDSTSANSSFEQLFDEAMSGVTKDKLDGAKVMSASGYFFADAFGLVRPTATGIKGLDGIDALSANTLLPEVLSALVRANAGYPADSTKECTTPKRFGVMPSQALQKEVFPWIKPLLIGAFEQSNNNDDVRSATRLLRVLRELRIVLLQDVAFLMEMPYLNKVIEENVFFKHELFNSSDFKALRREMRATVGETEIRDMEVMCTVAVNWVKNRRSEVPDGSTDRMTPTAPRLLNPETYSVSANGSATAGPGQQLRSRMENAPHTHDAQRFPGAPSLPTSHATDEDHKRRRDSAAPGEDDSAYFGETGDDAYDSDRLPKRSRRIYEMALNISPYRIYGDGATASGHPDQLGANPVPGDSSDNVVETLNNLRVENQDLKSHVRKLEWLLSQHKAEVQAWMGKMEKTVQSVSVVASRQPSPHMRSDPVQTIRSTMPPSASPAMAARQPTAASHMQPTSPTTYGSRQPPYHEHAGSQNQLSQPSTPRTRYIDGQYQPPTGRAPGLHAQSSLHGIRESSGHYERPGDVANGRQYQQMPMQPATNGRHQEYRGPPTRIPPSPRSQSYGQRPTSSEYSDYRPNRQQENGAYQEPGWYAGSRDESAYPPPRH